MGLEVICADGGQGLIAAPPTAYPGTSLQCCWAHKIRNIVDKVRKPYRDAVKAGFHSIMNTPNRPRALRAARRFADTWETTYPRAVTQPSPSANRSGPPMPSNAIELRFQEVRRRSQPTGTFHDRTSMDRILFAVFTLQNKCQRTATPFPLTHSS